ncbi:MAG: PQQ-binding-like beta-propeller repeat protein, partial [Fimbriiglobus sp.]
FLPTLAAFALAAVAPPVAETPTWPQWRGPTRDGHVAAAAAWPDSLGEDALTVRWKAADLGDSYSGPVVTADRVFVTGTVGKTTEVVRALDRVTGKELWKASWDGAITVPFFAAKNGSWIRATPAVDADTVYVAGIRDVLVALDAGTGKERWRLDFPKQFSAAVPTFGFVSSPLIHGDALFVQAGAALVKLDKRTGKVLWTALKDNGGMMDSAFSSPVLATLAEAEQLVVQTRTKLAGVDPATGDVLWSRDIPTFRGMNILTPVVVGGGVFTSTYGGDTRWFPVTAKNGKPELGAGWSFRYEGYMGSPVVVGGHAYFLGKDQRAVCVDLTAGKEAWRSEKRFGQYWSVAANRDKLLALDQRGVLYLVRANPAEFDLIAERKVGDGETWAHVAVCGDEIFVRDLTGITAFRWSLPAK